MRFAAAAGYDCADMKFGYLHWGARWVFPLTERLMLDAGLGPSLIFRKSWTKRFAELVDDGERDSGLNLINLCPDISKNG
ncbi:MAG: hypothetical protein Ct9H300mP28_30730 [Pseudomonadota bacterium]|nr:MAG: hypothetical protein Ct9H300mP28_30730 [Pseudomonadota bacterium]